MTDDQLPDSVIAAADAIKSGEISARELTSACIEKAERLQPKLNCFISFQPEKALAAADALDALLLSGDPVGPLHGVPMAHKDMYYRKGRISGCGSQIRKDFVPNNTRE